MTTAADMCSIAAGAMKHFPATETFIMSNPGEPERRPAELVLSVEDLATVEVDFSSLVPGPSAVAQWRGNGCEHRQRLAQHLSRLANSHCILVRPCQSRVL
ncbi:hypothetical protein LB577_04455 [Mesorhizobium sp. B283B1A]|uniref:hypothetical protein n=1 Tax=Mesorhizobium TaxID=68287 RepID=UPI001CD15BF0|nr:MULTISPECIES: hypothetical protein [Mesorhizobium]MCA0046209.1 hypothetical protein [Mesorhizobium sp. B283B1A]UQS62867.1 hypothetical protein M5D98_22325 [Mesorhizobium opportunistum]